MGTTPHPSPVAGHTPLPPPRTWRLAAKRRQAGDQQNPGVVQARPGRVTADGRGAGSDRAGPPRPPITPPSNSHDGAAQVSWVRPCTAPIPPDTHQPDELHPQVRGAKLDQLLILGVACLPGRTQVPTQGVHPPSPLQPPLAKRSGPPARQGISCQSSPAPNCAPGHLWVPDRLPGLSLQPPSPRGRGHPRTGRRALGVVRGGFPSPELHVPPRTRRKGARSSPSARDEVDESQARSADRLCPSRRVVPFPFPEDHSPARHRTPVDRPDRPSLLTLRRISDGAGADPQRGGHCGAGVFIQTPGKGMGAPWPVSQE